MFLLNKQLETSEISEDEFLLRNRGIINIEIEILCKQGQGKFQRMIKI